MTARKRPGRPEIWRTEKGKKFVEAVAIEKYRHDKTTGAAIKKVLNNQPEFAEFGKYKNRYIQKQLIDVAEFFGMHPIIRQLIGRSSRIYWNKKTPAGVAAAGVADILLMTLVLGDAYELLEHENELLER